MGRRTRERVSGRIAEDKERAESERKAREAIDLEELLKRKEREQRRPTILTGTAGLTRRTLY